MANSRDFILFATADWNTPYWTNKQHTAHQLAQLGNRVLYVESIGLRQPNLSSGRDISRIFRRLWHSLVGTKSLEKNISVFSPLVIPFKHHWPIVRRINQGLLRYGIHRYCRKLSFNNPIIWTYHPFMLDALQELTFNKVVYHCVDDLAALPGIDADAFRNEERKLLARAEIVFTTSSTLYERCIQQNQRVFNFPNVVDIEHFSSAHDAGELPPEYASIPEPRIGYVGVLSDFKVNFELILDVAKRKPDWHWVFIGEEREGQASKLVTQLRTLPNVHFLGFKPYSQLPNYLRFIQVGALPSQLNEYTRSMFPMKYFEYLAAGLPIVSTSLDFTQTHSAGIEIAIDPDQFVIGIGKQLQHGKFSRAESLRLVGENTWRIRLLKMLELVEQ
jgi:glycosyltransferase involved in cell wall biosynthesis